ncbi:MAG: TlyA family RNA methyltransferase [Deltaproteobacteria bacterium]|nr:TlyA family RNA methyltransferase [Deltaproteobacteria bacterium]
MSKGSSKVRADVLLVERSLAESRTKAQAMIMAGRVWIGETRVDKAGTALLRSAELRVDELPRFVSRGGDKLDHAVTTFAAAGLEVADKICVDVGASTGGFTDCLLQRGARQVHAIDVGYGQLHPRLRQDPQVEVRERTNARHLTAGDFDEPVDLVVVDASFISIGKLIGAIAAILGARGELVALIKPQFEAGKEAVARGRGVIRDAEVRQQAIDDAVAAICRAGFVEVAHTDSPIKGPKGNLEHFVYARRLEG